MKLINWPGNMLNPMNQWVDRFFPEDDSFFKEFRSTWANQPAVNVKETDDAYMIEVAAPGLDRKDFQITCEDGMLMISAEQRKEEEKKETDYMRREFNYSRFERRFNLPDDVMPDKVDARYENGVLMINMPRKAMKIKKETRMIEVE
ncbi:MAG: Hsp20/alpha crystallin family protein [Lewinellaceae bacterium]|nr:Hsp20/alpha crystallin family protein [Lewinellaceae bacterium]